MSTRLNTRLYAIGVNKPTILDIFSDKEQSSWSAESYECLSLLQWSQEIQPVVNVRCGNEFNIYTIATNQDELLVFGYVHECQEALPHQSSSFYIIPASIMLICLEYYGNHRNVYYSAGSNDYGECAVEQGTQSPAAIQGIIDIDRICAGIYGNNVLWITHSGGLYANGANAQYQLGLKNKSKDNVFTPQCISFFADKNMNVINGTTSNSFCIVITDDGKVWSCGHCQFGSVAQGSNQYLNTWTNVATLSGHRIIDVAAGDSFVLFLENDGNVWGCGCNMDGSLGTGTWSDARGGIPQRIAYFAKHGIAVQQIECGRDHALALDADGKVYAWGDDKHGQLASGSESVGRKSHTPCLIQSLSKHIVVDIKCGTFHAGCVTEEKRYFLWGSNKQHECCVFDERKLVCVPFEVNEYVAAHIPDHHHILNMFLGDHSTLFLVNLH